MSIYMYVPFYNGCFNVKIVRFADLPKDTIFILTENNIDLYTTKAGETYGVLNEKID